MTVILSLMTRKMIKNGNRRNCQLTVTVIDGWKLLGTGCDTSQGTVNFRIELQSDFGIPGGVVSQGLSEIGFSGRTELNRIHS